MAKMITKSIPPGKIDIERLVRADEKIKLSHKRYAHSPKGQEAHKRYEHGPKGKLTHCTYRLRRRLLPLETYLEIYLANLKNKELPPEGSRALKSLLYDIKQAERNLIDCREDIAEAAREAIREKDNEAKRISLTTTL